MPLFVKVLSSNRDVQKKTVRLVLMSDDQKQYDLDLVLDQVPTVIFALSSEMGRILSTLPEGERPPTQPIQGRSILPAISPSGDVALILALEGGGELTIELPKKEISDIADALAQLAVAAQKNRYH